MQVDDAFRDYAKFTDLRAAAFYGGVGYGKQREELKRGVDVVIATPGRLLDYLEQREISLQGVEILVLDEVDRMLDMGFLPDVRRIVEKCPPREKRQTLFFSATLPPEIEKLTQWALQAGAGDRRDRRAAQPGGNGDPRVLSGGDRAEVRSAERAAGEDEL